MSKVKSVHRCESCGATEPKWVGQCPSCGAWGSLVEEAVRDHTPSHPAGASRPVPLAGVESVPDCRRSTTVPELDRVLGGGLVPGSVTLLGGEPGIGKSTLLLQVLAGMALDAGPCLLVTAEESASQVRMRADRLRTVPEDLLVLAETGLPEILGAIDGCRPAICVVDSIQAVLDPDIGTAAGSITQVRDCAHALTRVAKERNISVILVGHVTKDGSLAGPRALEHVVDTVLSFEGDRHHALRLLRAVKHRFGPTGELGLFEMTESGMAGVADPSGILLGDRRRGVAGSVVAAALEGRRPLLVEVQSLVGLPGSVERSVQGIDRGRLALLIAVLERHQRIRLSHADVFASAVGGVRLAEPASDLAVALALVSAVRGRPVPDDLVVFGEVGLGGELRQVPHAARRLAEAARLGFRQAIVPASAPDCAGMQVIRVPTLADAIDLLRLDGPGFGPPG